MAKVLFILTCIISLSSFSQKDLIILKKNSVRFNCTIININDSTFIFEKNGEELVLDKQDVDDFKLDNYKDRIAIVLAHRNKKNDIPNNSLKAKLDIKTEIKFRDSVINELDRIRYYIGKKADQYRIGSITLISGLAASTLGAVMVSSPNYNDAGSVLLIASSITSFIGTFIILDSNKWIKKASFKPSRYGIGVSYNF